MTKSKRYLTDPEFSVLMVEWDWDKNDELGLDPNKITHASNLVPWWVCSLGHSWSAIVSRRTLGRGCPYCSNTWVLEGYNDLGTTNPELSSELLNSTVGRTVTGRSNLRTEWICRLRHVWVARVVDRANGSGCPKCSNNVSGPEKELIKFLPSDLVSQHKLEGVRSPCDIFIPSLNLIVEYDGAYFHKDRLLTDLEKSIRILERGYNLLRIRERKLDITLPILEIPYRNYSELVIDYRRDCSHIRSNKSLILKTIEEIS